MLVGVLDKLWRFLCCSSTVDDHTEHEVRKRANEADTEEFYEWNDQYITCCGLFHIKTLVRAIIVFKTFIFGLLLLSFLNSDISPLVQFGFFLAFGLALTSYAICWMGIRTNRFHLLIPYFFVAFILIVIAVVHLFVDFLDSANTRDTLESHRVSSFLMQLVMIVFEIYALMLIWRVFQYICDARMAEEIEERLLAKSRMYDDELLHIV